MRKSNFSAEEELKWVKKYLNGEKSCAAISKECCVAGSTLGCWVNNYTTQGIVVLLNPGIAKFKAKFAA